MRRNHLFNVSHPAMYLVPLIMTMLVLVFGGCEMLMGPAYMVTYDGNGHTAGGPPSDGTEYDEGETVTVESAPSDMEYEDSEYGIMLSFAGWNTKADGTGTSYEADDTFTINGNITLYAMWTAIGSRGQHDASIIFYENPDHETDGWRYMEGQSFYSTTPFWWGPETNTGWDWDTNPDPVVAGADGITIGTGLANTQAMVASLRDDFGITNADTGDSSGAKYAAIYVSNMEETNWQETEPVFNDWFLASLDEVYEFRKLEYDYDDRNILMSFSGGDYPSTYWTSSEKDAENAYYVSSSSSLDMKTNYYTDKYSEGGGRRIVVARRY